MTSKERVLQRERDRGRLDALEVQAKSPEMTGTELNAADDKIPSFKAAVKKMNILKRHAGLTDGFVCRSSAGRVVRLIQNYDSDTFKGEPEELPAQYGFVWSNDPAKAKPFIAVSTSPYMKDNCCIEDENVYRSKLDYNVQSPKAYTDGWAIVLE